MEEYLRYAHKDDINSIYLLSDALKNLVSATTGMGDSVERIAMVLDIMTERVLEEEQRIRTVQNG